MRIILSLMVACAPKAIPGTQVRMQFSRQAVFNAPIPSNDMLKDDGHVDVSRLPNPNNIDFVKSVLAVIARDARGFSTAAPIFFTTTAAIDPANLPDYTSEDASVFLMNVDSGARTPVQARFVADGGPFGAANLLSVLPLQGRPLEEGKLHAAVVLRSAGNLGVSLEMAQLAAGWKPEGMSERAFKDYHRAIEALKKQVRIEDVAGVAVFTTDTPTKLLQRTREMVLQNLPQIDAPFHKTAQFDNFCVYETTLGVPVFQQGQPPYMNGGGAWPLDDAGLPVLQRFETANFIVSVPRAPMPTKGYPIVLHVRPGGGGHWWMVDRSAHATNHGPGIEGQGPANEYAKVGYAGSTLDNPHGGRRNISGLDEQLTIYNFLNPEAIRDNLRQSALELTMEANILGTLQIDSADCPGAATQTKFDESNIVMFGHSTGAWMTPTAAAYESKVKALILSGSGGSWIMNVIHKRQPLPVKGFAETMIGYTVIGRELTEHDPAVAWVQWAADPADPANYAPYVTQNVLMLQGILDTYIMPPIANTISVSLGLTLMGSRLDEQTIAPSAKFLPMALRHTTGENWQFPEDGIEDGHEVVFQTEAPKARYREFLQNLLKN